MLRVFSWRWGTKYPGHYVERLRNGLARNLKQDYTFDVIEPQGADIELTKIPGCFPRLRMFDLNWQCLQGINIGDRVVCLDLDLVITGSLDDLFDRSENFVILQGIHTANPCPYNGSLWMFRGGYRPDVWSDFSLEAAARVPFYQYPEDQAWMAAKIPDAAAFGPQNGVFGFRKPGWPAGDKLPLGAKIVAFPGARDPSQFQSLDWVREHWA